MNNTPENYVLALRTVAGDEPFANEACIELGLNRLHGQYFLWSYTAFETIHCASKKIDGANKLGKKHIPLVHNLFVAGRMSRNLLELE